MARLLTHIGLSGAKATGEKTTTSGQMGATGSLVSSIGICGATVDDVAACRSAIATFSIKHGQTSGRPISCNYPQHVNMYQRFVPEVVPPVPVISSTSDISAFVNVMSVGTSNLMVDITGEETPRSDIYGNIFSWTAGSAYNLPAVTYGIVETYVSIPSSIRGMISTHTEALTYDEVLIATSRGLSILRRLLTTMPDLTAYLHGWVYSDLAASIFSRSINYGDLRGIIMCVIESGENLYAYITATEIRDLPATLVSIPCSCLYGLLEPVVPKDLSAYIGPLPPKDLYATCGGHLPTDLLASLVINQPVPLKAWLRIGGNLSYDLGASITAYGGYYSISAVITSFRRFVSDFFASIVCKVPSDLRGFLVGWKEHDIIADIKGVRSNDIGAWVTPWYRIYEKDLHAFVRPSFLGSSDIVTFVHGWISTHTSDKPYNKYLYKRLPKSFLIGQFGGLTILRIETIWGSFPDLHAYITCIPLYIKDLKAYVNPLVPNIKDLSGSLNAVTRTINITKIAINIVNISELYATISAFSRYMNLYTSIRGFVSTSTSTSSGSGWVYTSSSVKFYLGTNKGILIPQRVTTTIRPSLFLNYSSTPDLVGYIRGWVTCDFTASITVQPYSYLYGNIAALDLSHVSVIGASVISTYTKDLTASLVGIGGFVSIAADISSAGGTSSLTASIFPYLKILGYRLIAVETRPFSSLRASINTISVCGYSYSYSNISAFIRPAQAPSGQCLLYASIYPRTDILDLTASVIGRMYTRLNMVTLTFRTKTRSSSIISSYMTGVGFSFGNLSAYIKGIPHETDLNASITPIRYRITGIDRLENIEVYKQIGVSAYLANELVLTFSSKVAEYIYDAIDHSIYELNDGRWALNLSEFTGTNDFFDRDPLDRSISIDNIVEYDSVDEAIRAAIYILTERNRSDLYASITAVGGYLGLRAEVFGDYLDKVSDLRAKITIVTNLPDLYASISSAGSYSYLKACAIGYSFDSPDIVADIRGVIYDSIGASIVGIT